MKHRNLKTAFLFLLVACAMSSCAPGGGGSPTSKPARKKMLNMSSGDNGWDAFSMAPNGAQGATAGSISYPPLPFALADTVISMGGDNADFYILRIPSSNMDFLLPMVMSYEPWLAGWINAWPQLGRQGIVIDLSAGKVTHRTTLKVEAVAQQINIPLVLLWDKDSESRAAYLTKSIQSLKTLRCENLQ